VSDERPDASFSEPRSWQVSLKAIVDEMVLEAEAEMQRLKRMFAEAAADCPES
jgi:hypothetical protein